MRPLLAVLGVCALPLVFSAQGLVTTPVQVSDILDRPIPHVILSAKGNSSTSAPTDKAGKTHLVLPGTVTPGSNVSLILIDVPDAHLRFLSPWEGRATIPLRDEVDIVLGVPGDANMLQNVQVRQSIRGALAANGQTPAPAKPGSSPAAGPDDPATSLRKISSQLGLNPMDVNNALQRYAKSDASSALTGNQHHHHQQPVLSQQTATATQSSTHASGMTSMPSQSTQASQMQSHSRKH